MVFEKVAKLIAETKGVDVTIIKPETTLQELGLDSLDAVQLVMDLEEEFSITIGTEKIARTVGEAVQIVEEKLAQK
ncbi:MAG: acyl carrier protein [Bacillota bacterium]|nr:acyl carrier protein [Bacillota bacterium]